MTVNINKERCRAAGFHDNEIHRISGYCNEQANLGIHKKKPALICLNNDTKNAFFVCETVAEVIDELRPGAWRKAETKALVQYLRSECHSDEGIQ